MRMFWQSRDKRLAPAPQAPVVPRFGQPFPCPTCGGRGYLDGIDLRMRVQHQHCVQCGHVYDVAEAAPSA
jgi:hypothetical protein